MQTLFTVLLIFSAIVLIASVLLQTEKSGGLSSAFGGASDQSFGRNKAKDYEARFEVITKISAVIFMLSSVLLAYFT